MEETPHTTNKLNDQIRKPYISPVDLTKLHDTVDNGSVGSSLETTMTGHEDGSSAMKAEFSKINGNKQHDTNYHNGSETTTEERGRTCTLCTYAFNGPFSIVCALCDSVLPAESSATSHQKPLSNINTNLDSLQGLKDPISQKSKGGIADATSNLAIFDKKQKREEEVREEGDGTSVTCRACTFANHPQLTSCEMCNYPLGNKKYVTRCDSLIYDPCSSNNSNNNSNSSNSSSISSSSSSGSSGNGGCSSSFVSMNNHNTIRNSNEYEYNVNRGNGEIQVQKRTDSTMIDDEIIDVGGGITTARSDIASKSYSNHNDDERGDHKKGSASAEATFNSCAATDGLIELLRSALVNQKERSEFYLCSPCTHVSQSAVEHGAGWSCGYRNIQQICLALNRIPEYRRRLFNGSGDVPDVQGIQSWIEKAWHAGFDVEGAEDYGFELLGKEGYGAWIGACECAALLRYFGIRAIVVDFFKSNQGGSSSGSSNGAAGSKLKQPRNRYIDDFFLPAAGRASTVSSSSSSTIYNDSKTPASAETVTEVGEKVGNWVHKYFLHSLDRKIIAQPENTPFVPPIYFQDRCHSRTIVGYEVMDKKSNLLLFDPISSGVKLKENLEQGRAWQRSTKRALYTLRHVEYQCVYIAEGILSDSEREIMKKIEGQCSSLPI